MSALPRRRAAGIVFIVAALQYLVLEAVSASAWADPPYSYAFNYISDLGVPLAGVSGGRLIDSPLAAVMNTGFVVDGVLFALAATLLVSTVRGGWRWMLLALALLHAAGIIVVGLVHGSVLYGPTLNAVHSGAAVVSILCGNLVVLTVGLTASRFGLPRWMLAIGIALTALALVSEVLLETGFGGGSIDGLLERGGVYTIIGWELLVGVLLVSRRPAGSSIGDRPRTAG